jgi:hypothetical protein
MAKGRQAFSGSLPDALNMCDGCQFPDADARRDTSARHAQAGEFPYLAGIIAKFRAAFRSRVPLGYEDETGFHLGVMSSEE